MENVWKGAEAFFINKGSTGCVLFHGGTGTPAVMRAMADYLADNGISVLGTRLKGFGTSEEEGVKRKHLDWIRSAEDGVEELQRHCQKVLIGGLSMGGSLALLLAGNLGETISGVICICAPAGPVFLESFRKRFAPLCKDNLPLVNFTATDIRDKKVKAIGYEHHYPSLNLEWAKIVEKSNRSLPIVTCPALIVQAKNDHVIDPATADWIYENVGSKKKEIFWLENSYHMATIDVDREKLFRRAVGFINDVAQ